MTVDEIKALLVSVDPSIKHYFTMGKGPAYTYWAEDKRLPLVSNDRHSDEGWRFYVHRFTKREDDPIATALFQALDADDRVAVSRQTDYEADTGYIHHIFTCEGC